MNYIILIGHAGVDVVTLIDHFKRIPTYDFLYPFPAAQTKLELKPPI